MMFEKQKDNNDGEKATSSVALEEPKDGDSETAASVRPSVDETRSPRKKQKHQETRTGEEGKVGSSPKRARSSQMIRFSHRWIGLKVLLVDNGEDQMQVHCIMEMQIGFEEVMPPSSCVMND